MSFALGTAPACVPRAGAAASGRGAASRAAPAARVASRAATGAPRCAQPARLGGKHRQQTRGAAAWLRGRGLRGR